MVSNPTNALSGHHLMHPVPHIYEVGKQGQSSVALFLLAFANRLLVALGMSMSIVQFRFIDGRDDVCPPEPVSVSVPDISAGADGRRWNRRLYLDSDKLLAGVIESDDLMGLIALIEKVGFWDGVAGPEEDWKIERFHLTSESVGDEGESVGEDQESDVVEDDDARFDSSSAPEEVMSCRDLLWFR